MTTSITMSDFSNAYLQHRFHAARVLVELVGIEPTTYGLQSRRSPS